MHKDNKTPSTRQFLNLNNYYLNMNLINLRQVIVSFKTNNINYLFIRKPFNTNNIYYNITITPNNSI